MWKWLRWLLLALLLMALYLWLSQDKTIKIKVVHASHGTVEQTIANTRAGTVTACQRAKMSLPIGGQIEKILVKEGQHVKQGQLLLSLWAKDKQTKKQQLLALVRASQGHKNQACILSEKAQKDAKRQVSLLQQKLTSEENLEQAQAQADAAHANCLALTAEVQANQAAVKNIDAYLEQNYLTAPFDGIIAEITGEIGEYTTPSPPGVATPPAVDILTDDCHYISAPIDEVDAADLAIGRPVKITLDAFRGQTFAGTLKRIAPYIQDYEKQARTVTVEVAIDNHQSPHFLAGYSADIEVILATKEDVLRLPSDLIINNEHVLVVNQDNIIERQPIKTGISNWQFTEIVQGLSTKDKVVASIGLTGVTTGAKVAIETQQTTGN
ncbi:macrolide transporter subunit MacA [Thalassotalea insulae]|uniref:Macrolide transporter subunit MacA n=1 Tax=Thalassotalea insulae TaxID=2056778 RepID=A0ABQ6GWD4_9GAMM|nr:efflux RND transporter periplasmic adaptor subunit [Thalassotalea insulae]GLX80172.1 macrolide transporter subunit MacA [Thalassotalea insulae]